MASFPATTGEHSIICLEQTHDSLTLRWPDTRVSTTDKFCLQMKENDDGEWKTLSSAMSVNSAKKKNLQQGKRYYFRFATKQGDADQCSEFSSPSDPMSVLESTVMQLDAPELQTHDGSSVTVQWKAVDSTEIEGYQIRYRSEDQHGWSHVDKLVKGTSVKKKGLLPKKNYFFSVKPVGAQKTYEFSPSSVAMQIASIPPYIKTIMPKELIVHGGGRVKTEDALAGKIIGLYFSAHWCGPCRNFTPRLATFYNQAKAAGKKFEIVFASCDHDEGSAMGYFKESHPWTMIPFDDPEREKLSETFRVSGIPRLVILSGHTDGHVIVDNAVGMDLSLATLDAWGSK